MPLYFHTTMETLEQLCTRATTLAQNRKKNSALAVELSKAANEHYGANCRSTPFLDIIKLSASIREKEKKNWKDTYQVMYLEEINTPQNQGYFHFTHYALGKTDLLLDGKLVNRIYALLLRVEKNPETALALPNKDELINLDPNELSKGKKKRINNLVQLIGETFKPLSANQFGYGGIIAQSHRYNFEEMHCHSSREDEIEVLDCSSAEVVREYVHRKIENFGNMLASSQQNVRKVGSVRDGASRYR